MVNAKALAHGATSVMAVGYVACLALSYIAPGFLFSLATSWVHTLNLEAIQSTVSVSFGTALYDLVSISVLTWVWVYATAAAYNYFARTEESKAVAHGAVPAHQTH